MYDEFTCVCLCCIDATAGVGSNEAKGGQPDSSGSHWPQEEEEESGITVLFCFSRGDIKQEILNPTYTLIFLFCYIYIHTGHFFLSYTLLVLGWTLFCLFHLHRFSKVLKTFLKGFGP